MMHTLPALCNEVGGLSDWEEPHEQKIRRLEAP